MLFQFKILDDLRPQQADHVGNRRNAIPRVNLFGDHGTTDLGEAFKYDRFITGFAQVSGSGQTVVPAPYDYRIICVIHYLSCTSFIKVNYPPKKDGMILALKGPGKSHRPLRSRRGGR